MSLRFMPLRLSLSRHAGDGLRLACTVLSHEPQARWETAVMISLAQRRLHMSRRRPWLQFILTRLSFTKLWLMTRSKVGGNLYAVEE